MQAMTVLKYNFGVWATWNVSLGQIPEHTRKGHMD